MERPAKRQRIGAFAHTDEDADDELFLDPFQVNAQRDPAVQLEKSRAVAAFKLKSTWEDVINRFERDFTGEDDIINFYADEPEVEVDNGHIRSLADADDANSTAPSETDPDEEERILHGKGPERGQLIRTGPNQLMPRPSFGGRLSGLGSFAPAQPRLSTMFSAGPQFPSFSSFSPFKSFNEPQQSIWNAPELPASAFNNHALARTVTKRKVTVKTLLAAEDDGSDDDDILMGDSTLWVPEKDREAVEPAAAQVAPPDRSNPVEITYVADVLEQPEPEKPTRPRSQRNRLSSAQKALNRQEEEHASAAEPEETPTEDTNAELAAPQERKKTARSRKQTKVNSSAKKSASMRRSEKIAIPNSDEDVLELSGLVAADVGGLEGSNNVTSSAESSLKAAKSHGRIEVHLQRRPRLDIVGPTQAIPPTPLSASRPGRKTNHAEHHSEAAKLPPRTVQPLADSNTLAVRKHPSGKTRRRTLTPSSVPSPDENQRDDTERPSIPAPAGSRLETPAKASPTKASQDDMVLVTQDQPVVHKLPIWDQSTTTTARKPVQVSEQFSRNIVDAAYELSDEDVSLVPPSRVKKSAKPSSKPSPVSRRSSGRRRLPTSSANLGSSPSIRTAFPAVKKSGRGTITKPQEEILSEPQPAADKSLPFQDLPAIEQLSPQVEEYLPKESGHPEVSAPTLDKGLSTPVSHAISNEPKSTKISTAPSLNKSEEQPVQVSALTTPSSSHSRTKPSVTPVATRPSTLRRSILSLLSDSEEDELSLSLDQISPLVRNTPDPRPSIFRKSLSTAKKHSVKRMSLGSRGSLATPKQKRSRLGSWRSVSTIRVANRMARDRADDGEVHRTPGGTLRRCGEDGFKCERDFCFACL